MEPAGLVAHAVPEPRPRHRARAGPAPVLGSWHRTRRPRRRCTHPARGGDVARSPTCRRRRLGPRDRGGAASGVVPARPPRCARCPTRPHRQSASRLTGSACAGCCAVRRRASGVSSPGSQRIAPAPDRCGPRRWRSAHGVTSSASTSLSRDTAASSRSRELVGDILGTSSLEPSGDVLRRGAGRCWRAPGRAWPTPPRAPCRRRRAAAGRVRRGRRAARGSGRGSGRAPPAPLHPCRP